MKVLALRNRQRTRKVDANVLRRILRFVLEEIRARKCYQLGIHLVEAEEMVRINETFLQHTGSTDVITFDYSGDGSADELHGEIFISIDDAVAYAKQFRTTWESELTRYAIHGVLHLEGFDDLEAALRKKMKTEENRILKKVSHQFDVSKLQRRTRQPK